METRIIKLTQSAIIEQRLEEFGKEVERQIAELNIENQVATAETVSTLKKMRADLKKSAEEFEAQRKALKNAVMKPYDEFEALYKAHIINKFKTADELLKSKISGFEAIVKKEKENSLREYFERLQEKYAYDFLNFKNCIIPGEILLSTSEKKYKDDMFERFKQVESDLALIETQEYASEILVEYKKTLNCSQAIVSVKQRKDAEKQEEAARLKAIVKQRCEQLQSIGFAWSDESQSYKNSPLGLSIPYADVRKLSTDDWFSFYQPAYLKHQEAIRPVLTEIKEEQQQQPAAGDAKTSNKPDETPQEAPQEIEVRFVCNAVMTTARFNEFRAEIKELFLKYSVNYSNV